MIKKIAIFLVVTVLLLAAAFGIAVYRASDIVTAFKPTIEQKLSDIVKADVTLGDLSLSVFPRAELSVSQVTINGADTKKGLSFESLSARIELSPLLSKRLEIVDLRLVKPAVTLVRDPSGIYVVGLPRSQGRAEKPVPPPSAPRPDDRAPEQRSEGLMIDLRRVAIEDAAITYDDKISGMKQSATNVDLEANVRTDGEKILAPEAMLSARVLGDERVAVKATGISFDPPTGIITFGDSELDTPGGKVRVEGTIGPDGAVRIKAPAVDVHRLLELAARVTPSVERYKELKVSLTDLAADVALRNQDLTIKSCNINLAGTSIPVSGRAQLSTMNGEFDVRVPSTKIPLLLAELRPFVPPLEGYNLDGSVETNMKIRLMGKGSLQVDGPVKLRDAAADLPGGLAVRSLSTDGNLSVTPAMQRLKDVRGTLKLNDEQLSLTMSGDVTPRELTASALTVEGFGGSMDIPFTLSLGESRSLSATTSLRKLDLPRLLAVFKPDLLDKYTGTITSFQGALKARLGGGFSGYLNGPGQLVFEKGALKNFNLAQAVLSKVDNLPFVEGSLARRIPPQYDNVLKSPDTPIDLLKASFTGNEQELAVSEVLLNSNIFSLESKGTLATTTGEVNLDATIYFTAAFSAELATSIKELKTVLASDGRLTIPLTLRGVPPRLVVAPNTQELVKLAGKRVIKDKAVEALDRALGKKSPGGEEVKKAIGDLLGF